MVERFSVKGFEAFKEFVETVDGTKDINAYFSGSKNDEGDSWCPDCVRAEPVVMAAVNKFAKEDTVFLFVDVGDKTFWKDLKNPFRTDKKIHIQVIPTIIRVNAPQRLEGLQCEKSDLLEMFFASED